ncbi:MAG: DUF2970 domain-containing protein [Nitrosomonadaceae bacterium]|nr:DUF2970 domain-containing protein [Nitrosomonadaceae bacterium]
MSVKETIEASPIKVAKAVFWAFLGIRKKSDHVADIESLTLKQIIVGGIIGGVLFVGSVLLLVKFATG